MESDPRVRRLRWGLPHTDKVERQQSQFYLLEVSQEMCDQGFFIRCRSADKSTFKLIIFDEHGGVRYQEESQKNLAKSCTVANLFFTKFDTYRLPESFPVNLKDDDTPATFYVLDMLQCNRLHITPGTHLVAVYGDNFFGRTSYEIVALPSANEDTSVSRIVAAESQLVEQKKALDAFKEEFMAAKAAFERAVARLEEESKTMAELIQERENAYNDFVQASQQPFAAQVSSTRSETSAFDSIASAGMGFFSSLRGMVSSDRKSSSQSSSQAK